MTSFCCGQPMNQRYTSLEKVLMRRVIRPITCLLMVLCVSLPAYPFDSPLSDEAVREAYSSASATMHPSWPSTSNFSRRPRPALTSLPLVFLLPSRNSHCSPTATFPPTAPHSPCPP